MKCTIPSITIGFILLLLVTYSKQIKAQEQNPETLLQAAINAEIVEGNLEKAIELYQQIIDRFSGHRAIAAQALLRQGQAYETVGNQQARENYERLIREYSDQVTIVTEARARLRALGTGIVQPLSDTPVERMLLDMDFIGMGFGGVFNDGQQFVYGNDDGDVEVRNLTTGEIRLLTTEGDLMTEYTKSAIYCLPSPSGQLIAYLWEIWHGNGLWERELRTVNILSEEIKTVYRCAENEMIYPTAWTKDDRHVLAFRRSYPSSTKNEMILVSIPGGRVDVINIIDKGGLMRVASLSPDGRYAAYEIRSATYSREIFVTSIDGRTETQITKSRADDWLLGWSPDGSMIIFASNRQGSNSIWGMHMEEGKPVGSPILLHAGVGQISPLGISEQGTLFYKVKLDIQRCLLGTLNESRSGLIGDPVVLGEAVTAGGASFSQDGKKVAYIFRPPASYPLINVYDIESGQIQIIKSDPDRVGSLTWAPDGRSLLSLVSGEKATAGLYRIDLSTGNAQLVLSREEASPRASTIIWMPNGQDIIYSISDPENADRKIEDWIFRIVQHSLVTGAVKELYRGAMFWGIAVSPDEKWLAIALNDRSVPISDRANDILLLSLDGNVSRKLATIRPQTILHNLVWSNDSREIYTIQRRRERVMTPTDTTLVTYSDFYSIPIEGGEPRITSLDLDEHLFMAYLAPGGKHVVWVSHADMFRDQLWSLSGFLPPGNREP